MKSKKQRKGNSPLRRKTPAHPSRPATKKAVDLNALRIEAGKRGEGWCTCKWKWGDDLVGSLVSECAYHAPPPDPQPRMCVDCRWFEPSPYPGGSTHRCGSPRQPTSPVDGGLEFGWAAVHRRYDFLCGKAARWFEPAPAPAPEIVPTNEMGARPSAAEPAPFLAEDPNPFPPISAWIKARWAAVFWR